MAYERLLSAGTPTNLGFTEEPPRHHRLARASRRNGRQCGCGDKRQQSSATLAGPDVCLIVAPQEAPMSPSSSIPQLPQSVSRVLISGSLMTKLRRTPLRQLVLPPVSWLKHLKTLVFWDCRCTLPYIVPQRSGTVLISAPATRGQDGGGDGQGRASRYVSSPRDCVSACAVLRRRPHRKARAPRP